MNNRIKLLDCCIALAVLALASGARAGENIDKTIEAASDGVVEIENVRGTVDVAGWNRNEVQVEGELDDLAEKLIFERDGRRTLIEVRLPDDVDSGDGSSLTVHVPSGSRVELRSVSADVTVKDVSGGVSLHTVSGDVIAHGLGGDVSVKSVSGDVNLRAGEGKAAQVKTVSGDLDLTLGASEVELSTVSGDVKVELGRFERLGINTVSGDLRVRGELTSGGRVECKSVSGLCELRLKGKVDARVSVRTGPGGEISNGLNSTKPEEEFPSQQRLDTTVGDGSGSITGSTVSGNINLISD